MADELRPRRCIAAAGRLHHVRGGREPYAAALFTGVLLAAGWLLGRFASDEVTERQALLFGFPARNMAVASLLAVAAFGQVDIAAFAAVFFLVQVLVLMPLALFLGQARH